MRRLLPRCSIFPSLGRAKFAPFHCKGPRDQPQNSPSWPVSPWLSRTHMVFGVCWKPGNFHKETLETSPCACCPFLWDCHVAAVLQNCLKWSNSKNSLSFQGTSVSVCSAGPALYPPSPRSQSPGFCSMFHSKLKPELTKSALHKWNIFSLLAGWVHTLKNRSRTVI